MLLTELSPKKILVRSTNWIGDAIMTTPAVRTIRENFPEATISMLVHPWVADVFIGSPHVDEVILYQKKKEHAGLGGIWRLARELRKRRFDMGISLQRAFEAAVIMKLAAIPVRAGDATDGRSLLLTHPVRVWQRMVGRHQVHYYQELMKDLGLQCGPTELFLQQAPEPVTWAAEYRQGLGDGPVVGLNPGAAYGPAKRWPAEYYGALARRLAREIGATLVVFGTDADRPAATVIAEHAPGQVRDLAGQTTLAQAMALIGRCDAFVTNDSGLMHVAAAQKTPLVAIFGSTNAIATGPFADNVVVLSKNLECAPCMKRDCRADFRCMLEITADEAFAATVNLLRDVAGRENSQKGETP